MEIIFPTPFFSPLVPTAQISSLVNVTTDVGGTAPFVCSNVATVHAFEKVWWRVNEVPLEDLNRTDVTQTLSDSGVGILTFTNVSADDDGIKVRCSGRRMITGVIVNSTDDAVLHVNGQLSLVYCNGGGGER